MSNSHITAAKTAAVFVVLITLVFSATLFAPRAVAQVPVVESDPIIRPIGQSPRTANQQPQQQGQQTQPGVPANNPMDQLFEEIQSLRQQLREQNGLIEELSFEVRRLKQQQMEDYTDLDRRLGDLSQGGAVLPGGEIPQGGQARGTVNTPNNPPAGRNVGVAGNTPASRDETSVYRAANDLISAREWDKAIAALQGYLQDFPGGRYESNAYYWLGELYFVKDDLPNARDAFQQVINDYPDSTKIDASKYKLARTYFQLGDKQKAQDLLEEVASTNNDSSRQAALFLRENF